MLWSSILVVAAAAAPFAAGLATARASESSPTVLDPITHDNLSVYFVRGPSAPGPVPLTLAEALAKGTVTVHETGSVNELKIENTGSEDVFVQAGDIVKGGQQDRVLTVSLIVPSRSGQVPIGVFCVEHGRWSARGREDVKRFASAEKAVPSREAKLAMMAPMKPDAGPSPSAGSSGATSAAQTSNAATEQRQSTYRGGRSETGTRQSEVWANVDKIQGKLSKNLNARVASGISASSLQLSLENEKLDEARRGYIKALAAAGEKSDDIVGVVVAINGRVSSADVYPSNGLFRKMWPKLLDAAATEAIGEKGAKAAPAPNADAARAFMMAADKASPAAPNAPLPAAMAREIRDADQALLVETRRKDGSFVHRTYLAK
jgi:hypothetical protein